MKKRDVAQGAEILYLAPGDVLKGRVEPILWMRTCEWFSRMGYKTTLLSVYFYRQENIRRAEIFSHFGIEERFGVEILPTLLSARLSWLWWVRFNLFSTFLVRLVPLFIRRRSRFVVYSKGQICMQAVLFLERVFAIRLTKVFELHSIGDNPRLVRMLDQMDLIVTNSEIVALRLVGTGIDRSRILTAYNAPFSPLASISRRSARRQLSLDQEETIVTYAGKLYERNVAFLIQLAKKLAPGDIKVHIVGGNPRILAWADEIMHDSGADNIRFFGFKPPAEVPNYLAAADALFCSYANDLPNIEQATPAKYFDYMQAEKPLFCSRNTAIQELLIDGVNCIYFEPEDPDDLAKKMIKSFKENATRTRIVENNRTLLRTLTWEERVRSIALRIQQLLDEHARDTRQG